MKKILSLLLTILIVVTIVPTFNIIANAATSGYYTYQITGGKATITDVSEKANGNISVPSVLGGYTVTGIGEHAFYECDKITKITLPDGVVSIGDAAFAFCSNLTSVELPNGIKEISKGAFSDCEKLVEVNIPDGVTQIGNLAFSNCSSLADIRIPSGVTYIGDYAFAWCRSLKSITLPKGVANIGEGAFSYCDNLAQISLNEGIESIAASVFYSCGELAEIAIPNGVTSIGNSAFEGCAKLKRVTMPNTVENIGSYAFYKCYKLTDVWYGGSESDELNIGHYNEKLVTAKWHYGMCRLDQHEYSGNCFNGCSVCGWIPDSHTYVNACDTKCNGCGKVRKVSSHSYDKCFDGYDQEMYGSWVINLTKSGVYQIKTNSAYTGDFSIHNIAVFDSQGKEVLYYEKLGGFPLASGCNYTVKFKYNCENEIDGTIIWIRTRVAETIFPDTDKNGWYNDAVVYAVGRGIMSGYASNGKFGTSDSIQRQDFLVMLARLDGADLSVYDNKRSSFPDVDNKSYYKAAVMWGYENGIVTGYDNGKFGVGDKITREQLVTFLYRYAKYKELNVGYKNSTKQYVSKTYSDYKFVSAFAIDPVLWAIENGVIKGKTDTAIVPQGNAQRCEVAQIMYNIFKNDLF